MELFDCRNHCYQDKVIQEHSMFPKSRTPETIKWQCKTLNKWNKNSMEFRNRRFLDAEVIDTWKLHQLSRLVDFAFVNTVFYQDLYSAVGFRKGDIHSWDDFAKLPIITKDDLINNFPSGILSPGVCEKTFPGLRTSGSSGKPVTIILDRDRVSWDFLERLRMFEWMLGRNFTEEDWIYSIDNSPWWFSSLGGKYRVFTIRIECPPEAIAAHIRKLKPRMVSGVGHKILEIIPFLQDAKDIGIDCFSTNSEPTSDAERKQWAQTIGVPVLDEYSSEELGYIAYECEHGSYHVMEDLCHIELKTFDPILGPEVIGTELWNYAMPTIKYRQGDLATWSESKECRCGSTFRILHNITGRADGALWSPAIGPISPMKVVYWADETLVPESSGIQEFKIAQDTEDTITVYIILKSTGTVNSAEKAISLFKRVISNHFKYPMKVITKICSQIPLEPNGKREIIKNNIKR